MLTRSGEMFVMLFIYVAPLNYSFVYLFMAVLTAIGKFIFAEGQPSLSLPPPPKFHSGMKGRRASD